MWPRINRRHAFGLLTTALVLSLLLSQFALRDGVVAGSGGDPDSSSYIVQATSSAEAARLVVAAGGTVTATLNIINAVGANLEDEQVARLRAKSGRVRVYEDNSLEVSGPVIETEYPELVGADVLHEQGITGQGVTIAVLDTGLWKTEATEFSASGAPRILAQYDAILDETHGDCHYDCGDDDDDEEDEDDRTTVTDLDDWNGHGTHITSIMVSSGRTEAGRHQGIAPNAGVVAVRAFEPDGSGTYLNVIKALDWIVSHRRDYDIRILNLSFGATAASHYWDDPVNQAVMQAWRRGIVVVAAAGNNGPGPMTVGVPGNVPYVITVGAVTDNYTPSDRTDDRLVSFSAAGPTVEGFVKPDLVAPGGHMLGHMPPHAWLPLEYPAFVQADGDYFRMSGTSQAAAVVSGVLALMLQADPSLDPDEAKCRVMASARTAMRDDGSHAYSVFQQGAGLVDAVAALSESALDCANRGMYVSFDLWGIAHYAGPAGVDADGTYYLVDSDGTRLSGTGFEWSRANLWPGNVIWEQGVLWNEGALWNTGVQWTEASSLNPDSLFNQGALWPEGSLWPEGLNRHASTYTWVEE